MATAPARPLCPCGNGRPKGHQGSCRGSLSGAAATITRKARAISRARREVRALRARRKQLHARLLSLVARLTELDERIGGAEERYGAISRRNQWSPAVQPPALSEIEVIALRALRSATAIETSAVLPDVFEHATDAGYNGSTWTLRSALDALAKRGIIAHGAEEGTYRRASRGRR